MFMKKIFFFLLFFYITSISAQEKVTDIDGNVYNTVKIGDQVWLQENLKTTRYKNGDSILNVVIDTQWSALQTGGYCIYESDTNNAKTYGKLYNWFAVNDKRGLAPKGWHIPTHEEWKALLNSLGGEKAAGIKLKEKGELHWTAPNSGANNESGFTALPGGYCWDSGGFYMLGSGCYWWTTTENIQNFACIWFLTNKNDDFRTGVNNYNIGNSVRCIKDK
jgi:uncharacterized protein (TIGR02145 family)